MTSPIESMFLNAVIDLAPQLGCELHVHYGWRSFSEPPVETAADASYGAACDPPIARLVVFPQALLDGYRADFFMGFHREYRGESLVNWIAIECDGHDWHERTPQQAAYDRARDRALLRGGIATVRFTGSEINRDANQCAREALDSLRALANREVNLITDHAFKIAMQAVEEAAAEARSRREPAESSEERE
jgi:very-short-patch-repair endonuclease